MNTSEQPSTTSTPTSPPAESEEPTLKSPDDSLKSQDNALTTSKYDPNQYSEQQREERRNKVWKMSIVDRMTQREIAKEIGMSVFTVNQDLKWVETNRVKSLAEADRGFVVKQDEIYESLLTKWLPVALRELDTSDESYMATDKVARILGDQAKLHGFGQAGKVSSKEVGKEMGEYVLKAMQSLVNRNVIEGELVQPALEDAKSP
jgi:DNA-binding CsgD family transcriptional regulator